MTSDPADLSPYFSEESIYKISIMFQGKFEGEYKFKALRYEDAFYTKPSSQRILFLDDAEKSYPDIPGKLLSRSKEVIARMRI